MTEREIIFIEDVVILTGLKKSTIYSKSSRGELPVAAHGRPLAFLRSKIVQWMLDGRPKVNND